MTTVSTDVLPLDTTEDSLEVVGGKGRSLARLANAGFAVPGGFHVTTAAYKTFVLDHDLQAKILELAKPELKNGRSSFESASAAIQKLFEGKALSADLTGEISAAYASLGGSDPAVAVRSSANAEDLPGLSFAGQQETFLNVRGTTALLEAVRNCWASLWTTQAIMYRHQMGIEQSAVAMAVVVQIMVPSEVSGILFTANPATGERGEMILNASFGLGEAVVGGQVTPDTYIVSRDPFEVKETILGPKEQKIVADGEQGVRLEDTSEAERAQSSLSEAMLEELTATAVKIEKLYEGHPQDIEWAISDGKLQLLQSRPITNLPPQAIEVEWIPNPPAQILTRRQIVENIPDPTCPLFEELYLTRGLENARGGKSLMVGGGPIFVTLHGFAYQRADWPQLLGGGDKPKMKEAELEAAEQKASEARAKFKQDQTEAHERDLERFLDDLPTDKRQAFDDWSKEAGKGDLALKICRPKSDNPTYTAFNNTEWNTRVLDKWKNETLPALQEAIKKWQKVDISEASDELLLEGIEGLAIAEGDYWSNDTSHTFGVAKSTDDQLQCFLRETLPDHHFTSGQFLSGFKGHTMMANEAMFGISQLIQANDSLFELVMTTPAARLRSALENHPASGPTLEAVEKYLDEYGHQGYTLDFVEPPQSEDPTPFFATLKTMVSNRGYNPQQHADDATTKRLKAYEDAEALLSGLEIWQFRFRLWFTHRFYHIREETMYYLGSAWPTLRAMARELGQRLVDAGTFENTDDIYYCSTDELREAMAARAGGKVMPELARTASERFDLREARKRLHPPGTVPPEASENPHIKFKETQFVNDPNSDLLQGVPVSPGTVKALASVIQSPAEFDQMENGSILVCPMTNPAWTPLFALASGLVTDIGGILGHGSIVAREYGIPAVVGTGNITQRVKSGQEVEVDGDAGIVTITKAT